MRFRGYDYEIIWLIMRFRGYDYEIIWLIMRFGGYDYEIIWLIMRFGGYQLTHHHGEVQDADAEVQDHHGHHGEVQDAVNGQKLARD